MFCGFLTGKTSFIRRYAKGVFSETYQTTVGADFVAKSVQRADGTHARLQLWDIAGQDRFAHLTRPFFRGAHGALVVCDVTRQGTFDLALRWKAELDKAGGGNGGNGGAPLPAMLVANKCDLFTDMNASFRAGAQMEQCCRAGRFVGWMVTSAKDGTNVAPAMDALLVAMRTRARAARGRGRGRGGRGRGPAAGAKTGGGSGRGRQQPQRRHGQRRRQGSGEHAFVPKTPTFRLTRTAIERPKSKGKCC